MQTEVIQMQHFLNCYLILLAYNLSKNLEKGTMLLSLNAEKHDVALGEKHV
jgi:hypothetical protein